MPIENKHKRARRILMPLQPNASKSASSTAILSQLKPSSQDGASSSSDENSSPDTLLSSGLSPSKISTPASSPISRHEKLKRRAINAIIRFGLYDLAIPDTSDKRPETVYENAAPLIDLIIQQMNIENTSRASWRIIRHCVVSLSSTPIQTEDKLIAVSPLTEAAIDEMRRRASSPREARQVANRINLLRSWLNQQNQLRRRSHHAWPMRTYTVPHKRMAISATADMSDMLKNTIHAIPYHHDPQRATDKTKFIERGVEVANIPGLGKVIASPTRMPMPRRATPMRSSEPSLAEWKMSFKRIRLPSTPTADFSMVFTANTLANKIKRRSPKTILGIHPKEAGQFAGFSTFHWKRLEGLHLFSNSLGGPEMITAKDGSAHPNMVVGTSTANVEMMMYETTARQLIEMYGFEQVRINVSVEFLKVGDVITNIAETIRYGLEWNWNGSHYLCQLSDVEIDALSTRAIPTSTQQFVNSLVFVKCIMTDLSHRAEFSKDKTTSEPDAKGSASSEGLTFTA